MTLLIVKIALAILYPFLEYWLGKTKKVEANSALELLLQMIKKI